MKRGILILILGIILNTITAQELIDYELKERYTKEDLKNLNALADPKYDVDVYVVTYTSKKINYSPDTASGVLAVPVDTTKIFPLLTFGRGTLSDRSQSPSLSEDTRLIGALLASYGYHCIIPDLIGFGVSKGLHPYLNPESEAWACMDMIYATKELSSEENFNINSQNFVTGYSQGGHVAMALSKAIQNDPNMELTVSAPMSGPYSISVESKKSTLGDTEYDFCGYLGSIFLSAKYSYPDLMKDIEVEDAFDSPYSEFVREYENESISMVSMNQKMLEELTKNGGKKYPKRMFTEEFRANVFNDPEFAFNVALERMDVCNWVPESPMELIYCRNDDQVTYRNAIYADSLMRANGATQVSATDVFPLGNHTTCIIPAFLRMFDLFGEYQEITPVSTLEAQIGDFKIFPNPVHNIVYIDLGEMNNEEVNLLLTDINGRIIKTDNRKYSSNRVSLDLSNVPNGILFLQLITSKGMTYNKMIVKH